MYCKIRELNPRPISGFLTNSTDYIVPDILIDYQDSSWIIRLNRSVDWKLFPL